MIRGAYSRTCHLRLGMKPPSKETKSQPFPWSPQDHRSKNNDAHKVYSEISWLRDARKMKNLKTHLRMIDYSRSDGRRVSPRTLGLKDFGRDIRKLCCERLVTNSLHDLPVTIAWNYS